jgi:YidC/Oxa1 family membrane protein insertase
MDRTSRNGVFVCILLLAYLWWFSLPKTKPAVAAPLPPVAASTVTGSAPASVTSALDKMPAPTGGTASAPSAPAQIGFLHDDVIRATLTSHGAAIQEVELLTHKEDKTGNVVLNERSHSDILQLSGWPGADGLDFKPQQTTDGYVYTATLPDGVTWQRTYILDKGYDISVKDVLTNPGATEIVLPSYGLSVGRAEPLRVGGHYQATANYYLGCGWLTSKAYHLTTIGEFNPGFVPIVGIKTHDAKDAFTSTSQDALPLRWLGAENQFFAVLFTPAEDHLIASARFQCFNTRDESGRLIPPDAEPDIEATALFPEVRLPARGGASFTYSLYAGPKDYHRLNDLGEQQGELMNYGHFELLIVPMLGILRFFHSFVGNYGLAIILLTLCVKMITWPLQSVANHSGKKMQAVAPELKKLQAKYKEQPEKLNTETFALYKEYGVNPFGGCLPALVQMPVFFSLYYMLQNAGELRGQSFLWIHDLTQPDRIASIHGFGINLLPLLVTGLTVVMMRMTPQIGDPQQAKIAQFMPVIFLVFLYNFAAALSLYYVVNNCVSIFQIYRNLKKPLPELKRKPKKKKD